MKRLTTDQSKQCNPRKRIRQKQDKCVTEQEMNRISLKLRREQHRALGRELQLSDSKVDELEVLCKTHNYGDEEFFYRIIRVWKEKNGKDAKRQVLRKALLMVERNDIADEVFHDLREDPMKIKMQYKGIQEQIERNQREGFKEIELPQVNWTDRVLPLEELYVNLELLNTEADYCGNKGEPMQLEELFNKTDKKDPVRILVEGGPGYGKTTLCLKLLNDWEKHRPYISSRFKMIFLFELRYFKQDYSVESVLKAECEAIGVNGDDGINCIRTFQNETLLILDGFDEMNENCKRMFFPLLHKYTFPSMFVLVTSRRRMFEVEKKQGSHQVGFLQNKKENVNVNDVWHKRVLIKGVTTDKIEIFLGKYLKNDYEMLECKINSITRGEMREVFECPLFLILLAMILEEKKLVNISSKTTLYREFFNFIIRRNLIREYKLSDEEEVDIFDQTSKHISVQSLDQFGRMAIDYLCENKLMFEEKEILKFCSDKIILDVGFLTKIPQMEGRKRENFYQPIHKSFLEFVAAFAIWNLFKTDDNQFKREIERIGDKGLNLMNDSLFYIFLGGLMNHKAYALFQSLTACSLWFNIENLSFTNILLEIKDINSFFTSFKPILESFISAFYHINGAKGVNEDFFQSEIHSVMLKHSCDKKLIHVLEWNSIYSVYLCHELNVECLKLHLNREIIKMFSNEIKYLVRCKNISCQFSRYFEIEKWDDFVSVFNTIQSEKVHISFGSQSNGITSLVFPLLHKELIEGQWKEKNIDRFIFELNEFDDPLSLSLLVDLLKRNRINEGVLLRIHSTERTQAEYDFLKMETEELFNAIKQSKTIQEFVVINEDTKFSPEFNFNRIINPHLMSFHFYGSLKLLNSNEINKEKYSFEEITILSFDYEEELNLIRNIQGVKYFTCSLISFSSLVEMEWTGLAEVEELLLSDIYPESVQLLNSVSQFANLQVLTLNVDLINTIPLHSDLMFSNLFSSFNLRISEFVWIQNLELFSFFIKVLMDELKKKEKDENNIIIDSNEGKKVYLKELVISFDKIEMDFNRLKRCNGMVTIQSMLRNRHLNQCSWVDYDYFNNIKSDLVNLLFPSKDKFRIFYEVNGMDAHNSHLSQFDYRWFSYFNRFCIKFLE